MVTHIGPNGPGECGASKGNCPFGLENHYATAEEARKVWEERLAASNPTFAAKKKLPDTYEAVEAKRSEAYKALSEKMEKEFGQYWSVRMDEPDVYRGYMLYSEEAEALDRKLKGMKFAPRGEEPTLENMTKERELITRWLDQEAGSHWDDWEEMVDEPEFDEEFRDLYDRRVTLDQHIELLKRRES